MEQIVPALDTLFVLMGVVMVLAMHAGFAFLEVGTVRHKNQVNALVKIIVDFAISTIAYFFIGYMIAYHTNFFGDAKTLTLNNGYDLEQFVRRTRLAQRHIWLCLPRLCRFRGSTRDGWLDCTGRGYPAGASARAL